MLTIKAESVVVFDLDDTLYEEVDFRNSGFAAIVQTFCLSSEAILARELLIRWAQAGEDALGKLIQQFRLEKRGFVKADLLNRYRNHDPVIQLREGARELLDDLKDRGILVGLITDGRSVTQRNKIRALGLENLFELEVISEEFGSEKPDPKNYLVFQERFPDRDYCYIGDNTKKDFLAPNALQWFTIGYRDAGRNIHPQDIDLPSDYLPRVFINKFRELKVAGGV